MKVQFPIVGPTPKTNGLTPQVTTQDAVKEAKQTVADGFITRTELNDVERLAAQDGQPLAKQFLREFAAVAEAKFSAANPEVKGFAARLTQLFTRPDPVTQVPAKDVAQQALARLWSNPGGGGQEQRHSIEARFALGLLTGMEAVIEATALQRSERGAALTTLASTARSDDDAMALVNAAAVTGDQKDGTGKPAGVMTLEQQRDFAVALAANPKVSPATVHQAAEQLNGYNVGWSETQVRMRAQVMHTVLKHRPDAKTANELVPELKAVAYSGADLARDVVPLAEDLLSHGASLANVIASMNEAGGSRPFLYDVPRPLVEFVLRHAGEVDSAAAPAVANVVLHASDFDIEKQIIQKMISGKASAPDVLQVLSKSGTVFHHIQDEEVRDHDWGRNPQRTELALELYGKNNDRNALHAIHEYATQEGKLYGQVKSLETLISRSALPKEDLLRLIDQVRDTDVAKELAAKLGT